MSRLLEAISQPVKKDRIFSEIIARFFRKPDIWNSAPYFVNQEQVDLSQMQARVYYDLSSLLDEHIAMQRKLVYSHYGAYGIDDAYSIKTSEQSKNHERQLLQRGKSVLRAQLETRNALIFEYILEDYLHLQVGQTLVQISPRGSENEEYPGEKAENYVFINCYQCVSTDPHQFCLIQFRSYGLNDELHSLQHHLQSLAIPFSTPYDQVTQPLDKDSHLIISKSQLLPLSISLHHVEAKVFEHSKKWKVNIADLPDINFVQFGEVRNQTLTFLLQVFTELFESGDEQQSELFDEAVEIVIKHLKKWVQNHAENYQEKLSNKDKKFVFSMELIKKEWAAKRKQVLGEKLNGTEKTLLKTAKKLTALNPGLPLARLGSFAHCVVGTPTSLVSMTNLTQLAATPNMSAVALSRAISSGEISVSAVSTELDEIIANSYVEITLGSQTWMVPADWCTGRGCYLDPKTGVAMGPCDIPLNYPGSLAYQMNRFEFEEYKKSLRSALGHSRFEDIVPAFSESDREYRNALLTRLRKIIFKHTISLTECIANVVPMNSEALNLVPDIYERLLQAVDPLVELEKIVLQLEINSGYGKNNEINQFFVPQNTSRITV